MMGIVLGALGGFAAVSAIARLRHRRHGFGRRGPRGIFFSLRRLGLDRRQREEVWHVADGVRRAAGDLRFGKWRGLATAAEALGDETFDRARVEAEADSQLAKMTELRKTVVDGLAKIHAILTPEQRARVRELFVARTAA